MTSLLFRAEDPARTECRAGDATTQAAATDAVASLLSSALELASQGIPIFPCVPRRKEPLTRHGLLDATTDHRTIHRWWHRWPCANVGARTGIRFDILDVDVKRGAPGLRSLERLRRAALVDQTFRLVATPSGGLHLYFPASGDGNHALARAGIDYRGRNGYVLVPPSATEDGIYRVLDDRTADRLRALDWPAVVRVLGCAVPNPDRHMGPGSGGIGPLIRFVASLKEGSRNSGLFWAACRACDERANPTELIPAALTTGLDLLEVERTIASASRTMRMRR